MPKPASNPNKPAQPVALVTGAGRRIGKAIVEDLAAHGFAVAIHCNGSRADADKLASRLSNEGREVQVFQADLSDMTVAEGLIETVAAAMTAPVLLVNNASVFENDDLASFDWRQWDDHFAIHLKAPVELTRRFAARLPAGSEGLVVNIIDQRVWKLTPRYFTYSLSKAALWDATRTMAQALAPRVRVNAIGPGPTLANALQSDADFAAQVGSLLLRRGPALSEFGATIRYLWEARSITGQMIAIDGGQHLAWQTPDVLGVGE